MRTVHFELLRPAEIIAERERCPVAYVPLGPLEWHSLHMPLGTDPLNAGRVAEQVAERVGGVVLPTFFWGTERERPPEMARDLGFSEEDYVVGMDFPNHVMKSLYCREEFLALLTREILDGLVGLGYKLIVIVNGHGAANHIITLRRLCAEFTANSPAHVLFTIAFPVASRSEFTIGHADAVETSLMMALYPESVDVSQLPPLTQPMLYRDFGVVDSEAFAGDPTPDHTLRPASDPRRHATVAVGEQIFAEAVAEVEAAVRAALRDLAG